MPSSPGYHRNYQQEALTESPERKRQRILRIQARRAFEKELGHHIPTGYDVNHVRPLSRGGDNSRLDLRQASRNRSYPRNPDGSMKRLYK